LCPPMHRVTNGRWHWLDRTGFHFADRALVALQRIEETLSFFWLAQFGNNLAKNRCRLNSGRTYIVLVRNSWIIVAEYTARKMGRLAAQDCGCRRRGCSEQVWRHVHSEGLEGNL